MTKDFVELNRTENPTAHVESHIPSTIQADTLFTFTDKLENIINYLQKSTIFTRYCIENIEYLNIQKINNIAIPMKCFCDITLHRLSTHLEWYGYYGLAFSKEWGIKRGIQPVQYINPNSFLCKDFSETFISALDASIENETETQRKMKDFLLDQLMMYKPNEGIMENRRTNEKSAKCFTDECEWRFIADMSSTDYSQVYYDTGILTANLVDISNSLELIPNLHLQFDYNDLKHIIIKNDHDFNSLVLEIKKLSISQELKDKLISKIIIWDTCKEDF